MKGHAEIGGFARWGIKVAEMSAEIGRLADLPLYVHFGTLWSLPESGANGEDADTIMERVIPLLRPGDILAHPFTRHPGGFVNRQGEVHMRHSCRTRPWAKGRRRPWQPFLLPCRPQSTCRRNRAAYSGCRHARL
jgi:predicted amidohydrolase